MRSGTRSPQIARAAWIALAILGMLFGQSMAYRNSRKAVSANRRLHADLARISPSESELFVCWGTAFPLESILPLESPDLLRNRNLLWLSWLQQSPVNDAAKERFGIQDLPLALFDNPNVYLIADDYQRTNYQTYIREHYQLESDWDHCYKGNTLNVYKPVRVDPVVILIQKVGAYPRQFSPHPPVRRDANKRASNPSSQTGPLPWRKSQR